MAKFCTKCGEPLTENHVCKVKENNEKVDEKDVFNNYIDIIKNIFKNPTKMLKKYSNKKNLYLGILAIAVNAILMGIVVHLLINNSLKALGLDTNMLETALKSLNNEVSNFGISIPTKTNYGVMSGIWTLVFSFLIAGIIYVMTNIIYKKKSDIKEIISMVGVSEVCLSIGLIITAVVSFISVVVSCAVAAIFMIMFIVHLHLGLKEISTLSSDQIVITLALSIIIPLIAFIVVFVLIALLDFTMAQGRAAISAASKW